MTIFRGIRVSVLSPHETPIQALEGERENLKIIVTKTHEFSRNQQKINYIEQNPIKLICISNKSQILPPKREIQSYEIGQDIRT